MSQDMPEMSYSNFWKQNTTYTISLLGFSSFKTICKLHPHVLWMEITFKKDVCNRVRLSLQCLLIVYLRLRTRLITNYPADYLYCLSVGVSLSKLASSLKGKASSPSALCSGWITCSPDGLWLSMPGELFSCVALCWCLTMLEDWRQVDKWSSTVSWRTVVLSSGRENRHPASRLNQAGYRANMNLEAGLWECCFLGPSWQLPEQVQYRCSLGSYNAAFTRARIFAHTLKIFLTAP